MLAKTLRYVAGIAALVPLFIVVAGAATESRPGPAQDGRLGFVLADMSYSLAAEGASVESACPDGLSMHPRRIIESMPEGQRREGESDADYLRRLRTLGTALMTAPNGQNLCMNPEAGQPDPHHRVVTGDVRVDGGIDLDGRNARVGAAPASGTCAHDDFRATNGAQGIDNQFFRAVGCLASFLPTGQSNDFAIEMLTGSWGVLITLDGVDNLRNDDDVSVGIYANADPIQLSPTREPVANSTYAVEQDARFQTRTRGRIVNGVLTTEPADLRMHWVVNALLLDRPVRDARLQMTINEDGTMDGYLAGYAPVEETYDAVFGFRSGREGQPGPNQGQLAEERRRMGSANGYAFTAGHTCNGVYYALKQLADGDRDAATGECGSISMQYRIRAIPAFVVGSENAPS